MGVDEPDQVPHAALTAAHLRRGCVTALPFVLVIVLAVLIAITH